MVFPFNEDIDIDSVLIKIDQLIDNESVVIEEEIIKLRYDIFTHKYTFLETDASRSLQSAFF